MPSNTTLERMRERQSAKLKRRRARRSAQPLGRAIMATRFRIRIAQPSTPDLVHRLRNLGEDLSRSLGGKGRIDMAEVDRATGSFVVEVASARDLGDVAALLKKQVAGAGTDGAFAIERS